MHARLRRVGSCLAGLGILLTGLPHAARAIDPTPAKPAEASTKSPSAPNSAAPQDSDDELPPGRVIFRQSKIEERIRKTLGEPVNEIVFSDTTLRDAVDQLSATYEVPIDIDGEALGADGKNEDLRLTVTIRAGTSLRSALRSMLIPRGLQFVIGDDRLLITIFSAAQNSTPVRIYQVHDLVSITPTQFGFQSLIELITCTIDPETWREAGGTQGEIKPFRADGVLALVITQTEQTHDRIEEMLGDIRAARDAKVRELQRKHGPRRDAASTQAEALRAALAGPTGDGKVTFPVAPSAAELVAASNKLGLRLYRELLKARAPNDNLIISPIGTVAALGPVYAGAATTTAAEFETGLGLPPPLQFQAQFADLSRWMNDPTVLRSYRLRSRSHLFVQPSLRLTVGYVDTVRRSFDVTPIPLDFENREADAKTTIQKTAAADSDGFLDVGDLMKTISNDARLAAVNTVDFRGRWTKPFPISATTVQPFRSPAGPKQTNLMATIEHLDYYESDELQMVRKPYDSVPDAGKMSLYLLLPTDNPEALKKLEADLTIDRLNAQIVEMTEEKVQLHLPRFTFDDTFRQTKPLQELGLLQAFNDKADFSLIDGTRDLQLTSVEQKAKIEVNETETRAAAATVAVMGFGGAVGPAPIEVPKVMRCDRPFLFLLRDDTTGAILFLGRLVKPTGP